MTDWQFRMWRIVGRLRHLVGQHAWVPLENWTLVEAHALVEIKGYTCWFCPATRPL